jgi:hypothetical protein
MGEDEQQDVKRKNGRMEKWKNGRMEKWKNGRMEIMEIMEKWKK